MKGPPVCLISQYKPLKTWREIIISRLFLHLTLTRFFIHPLTMKRKQGFIQKGL